MVRSRESFSKHIVFQFFQFARWISQCYDQLFMFRIKLYLCRSIWSIDELENIAFGFKVSFSNTFSTNSHQPNFSKLFSFNQFSLILCRSTGSFDNFKKSAKSEVGELKSRRVPTVPFRKNGSRAARGWSSFGSFQGCAKDFCQKWLKRLKHEQHRSIGLRYGQAK